MLGKAIKFYTEAGADSWTINDRANHPLMEATTPFYYISVESVDGIYNADVAYESHPIPNAAGEKSGDVIRRGRTITLSGKIKALNTQALAVGADYLQHMFAETGLRKLVHTRVSDGIQVYYIARVNQDLTIVEEFVDYKYEWKWVVGLRCDDPFTYKLSDNSLHPSWQE